MVDNGAKYFKFRILNIRMKKKKKIGMKSFYFIFRRKHKKNLNETGVYSVRLDIPN